MSEKNLMLQNLSLQRIPALNSYDPGSCNETIHGKEVLVTDKTDEEVILICVRNKGVYQWRPLDGRFTLIDLGYYLWPSRHAFTRGVLISR